VVASRPTEGDGFPRIEVGRDQIEAPVEPAEVVRVARLPEYRGEVPVNLLVVEETGGDRAPERGERNLLLIRSSSHYKRIGA